MSSDSSEYAQSELAHTPFCDDNCIVQHHEILQQLMRLPGQLPTTEKDQFSQFLEIYKARGWTLDDPIPDPIPEFRFPMLHWAAALSKAQLASHLVKEGCSANKQTKQGDTPLHRCVICLKPRNKRGHLLVASLADNLHICNSSGQTPLLILAERLKQGQIRCDQFSDWLMTILDATMKMVDVGQRLKTFNTQNLQGDTALHLLCEVRNMLPSVRRMVQEARCNVKIRNKLGLTAMDVAMSNGFYDYVTEIKSVLPSHLIISPLRSSHPLNAKKKKTERRSGSRGDSRQTPTSSRGKDKETKESTKKAKKRSSGHFIKDKTERAPPDLDKMTSPQRTPSLVQSKQTEMSKSAPPKTILKRPHLSPEAPILSTPPNPNSEAKRPRKGTPYRVDRVLSKDQQEQRIRASNLDKILQQQCQGTPVTANNESSVKHSVSEPKRLGVGGAKRLVVLGADVDDGASTSGLDTDQGHQGHHSSDEDEDKCLLCNLENGNKMTGHLENGSKVSELKVSTAAAGPSVAHEPGASGHTHAGAGDKGESKANSKLLTYLQMNQVFQKEIVNKIHKDRRDLEKKIVEQESSIQVTAKELAKITSESNEVNRSIVSAIKALEILQKKEQDLKLRQDSLRKSKRLKETKLGESRTQLAVIAQSLLELQSQ